jgi:hypothetical protein
MVLIFFINMPLFVRHSRVTVRAALLRVTLFDRIDLQYTSPLYTGVLISP